MQLRLGVHGDWRSVRVELMDGCWPAIDGRVLSEMSPDPAVWFKVASLRCVSIDCAQSIISWTFLSSDSRQCCLMAPHQGTSPPAWTDELASVFELAEALFEAGDSHSDNHRRHKVEQRTWGRLLQSFVLPLVTFMTSDHPSLQEALSRQVEAIGHLDTTISESTTRLMQVKGRLSELRTVLLPQAVGWAKSGQVSQLFLKCLIADIRLVEDKARSKIKRSSQSSVLATGMRSITDSEQLLVDMLTARSQLVECLVSLGEEQMERVPDIQHTYIRLHEELDSLRHITSSYSDKKLLALSVRECLSQAGRGVGTCMGSPQHIRGTCMEQQEQASDYQTSRDKLNIVLSMTGTPVARLHNEFCSEFHSTWFEEFVLVNVPSVTTTPPPSSVWLDDSDTSRSLLVQAVKRHFDTMLEEIADHFNNHDTDFVQRMQLAYEKVFFDLFHKDFTTMYTSLESKLCERLQFNSLGASLLTSDPNTPPSIAALFPPLNFELVMQRYQEIKGDATPLPWQQTCSQDYMEYFGGMTFDLECLAHAHAPLEKLQLLTSAFRKTMTSLSALQTSAVCCDDLLPVMIMALIRTHPNLLVSVHINTRFLDDFIAPFLSSGWHGYSLTSFSSAIRIIIDI